MRLIINVNTPKVMRLTIKNYVHILLLFIFAPSLWAQTFTVTAVPTAATCNGNGAIALSSSGAQAGASVHYRVYKLPNLTTPVWSSTDPNVVGQTSGNYKVEATQLVGGTPFGAPAVTETTIDDNIIPLQFTIDHVNAICNDGILSVVMINGNPVTYEITAPIIRPPQTSTTFTGLAPGSYTIKVTDNCGAADSQVVTLFLDTPVLVLGSIGFPDDELAACNLLTILNDVANTNPTSAIAYPIEVTSTYYPPNGAPPIIYTQTIAGGVNDGFPVTQVVPYYYNQNCSYKFKIVDRCGKELQSPLYPVKPLLTVTGELKLVECLGRTMEVNPNKYMPPFTLQFTTTPAGFNPADYNNIYPGPYNTPDLPAVFGGPGNPLPEGSYAFTILDACGRTASSEIIEIAKPIVAAEVFAGNALCTTGLGSAVVSIPGLYMQTVIITAAPPEYPDPIPHTFFEQNPDDDPVDEVLINNLPPGEYSVTLIDTCGIVLTKDFKIAPYKGARADVNARVDCEEGFGTIRLSIGEDITQIAIVSAPPNYPHPLPHDVFAYVNQGEETLYMDHLVPGQYKFKAATTCDTDVEMSPPVFTINAYKITTNDHSLTPHCGSFDLYYNHVSNGQIFVTYSLQKLDEASGLWSHPDTGVLYTEGTQIINDPQSGTPNALKIKNNDTTYNLVYPTGTYRIVKQYKCWGDGSQGITDKLCTSVSYEFDYFNELTITGLLNLSCFSQNGDIQVSAFGVAPITYKIVSKNGEPFLIDNGENNTFNDLELAVYTVIVTDKCGSRPLTFNIADIPSLVYAPDPDRIPALEHCDDDGNGTEEFDISVHNALILDTQNPNDVTITYHATLTDAEQGTNAITNLQQYTTGSTTIHVRVTHISGNGCIALTSFNVIVRPKPVLSMAEKWHGCEGENISIVADSGFSSYKWSDGSTNQSTTVTQPGPYTVTVKDKFGCEGSKTVEVTTSPPPVINTVNVSDWTDNNNVISVVMEPTNIPSDFEYSIDNVTYQDSPTFTGLAPGQYTVYVKDKSDCGMDKHFAYILTYPKFFTPNGDGINETWRIKLSALEPDMKIYIYDRYGKLITGFDPNSNGWDGTLNGKRLPSTDYWFVVIRQNGQELKGHFSMIR